MQQPSVLEANADALDLAERMLERGDVRRDILSETLESAEAGGIQESGRAICGTSRTPMGPLSRGFSKVTLPTCPATVGGTWHTHITLDQFLNPENSLPDFANVAFGVVDVSIVAGAESSHVVVATADRSAMQEALIDELGVEVASPGDVAAAVLSGKVPDPPAVRRRLYSRLVEPIAFRVDTAEPSLAQRAQEIEFAMVVQREAFDAVSMSGCVMYAMHRTSRQSRMLRVIDDGRRIQESVDDLVNIVRESNISVTGQVITTAIGVTTGNIIERLLFG